MAVPQIFSRDMRRLAYLDNAFDVGYTLETNALWSAVFSMPADDKKNQYCEALNYIRIYDGAEEIGLFRIIGEDLDRSTGTTKAYNCEHVLATLLNDVLFQYHQCGGSMIKTPQVLSYILSHQTTKNWVLAECAFSRQFEYSWENTNLLAALFSVPQCFDREYLWTWDTTGYPWALSLTAPTDTLKSEIRYAKNMTGIHKTKDATNLSNRIYALGYGEGVNQLNISSVNGGKPYVEDPLSIERYGLCSSILVDSRYTLAENLKAYAGQMLKECSEPYISYEVSAIDLHRLTGDAFSRFRPGEIVRVVDEEDGVNLRTRIVTVEKGDALGDPGSISVTLANKAKDISGSISDLQSRALINETYAQGSTNQQIYNFADNADSTHPATMKLYISDSVVRINKMLLNIQFEPFRAFERAIEGGGGQTTSSGGGQTTSAGGGQTTSSGGGSTTSSGGGQTTSSGGGQTTSSGGGQTTSSGGGTNTTSSATAIENSNTENDRNDDGGEGNANHNHGFFRGMRIAYYDQNNKIIGYRGFAPSGKHTHGEHTHTLQVPNHSHTVSAHTHTVSAHTHTVSAHTHNISAHTHTVQNHAHTVKDHSHTVQNHTHGIEFGIYEGETGSRAEIRVDGRRIPVPGSYDNIDIVEYLSKDNSGKIQRNAWHTVEILPDKMSRIVAALFTQTFCNARGGGDY